VIEKNLENISFGYFMETLEDIIKGKKGTEYVCITCDFKCFKKYSWERHISTVKHIKAAKCDILGTKKGKKGKKKLRPRGSTIL
jgi:hypothetical protein